MTQRNFNWVIIVLLSVSISLNGLLFIQQRGSANRIENIERYQKAVDNLQYEIHRLDPGNIGHIHRDIAKKYLLKRAEQVEKGGVLLCGDSITEMLLLSRQFPLATLNCGIGGSHVGWYSQFAPTLLDAAKPRIVVVLIGVNDAIETLKGSKVKLAEWAHVYEQLTQDIIDRGALPVLATVLPVEKTKQMAGKPWILENIRLINDQIIRIGKEKNAVILDVYSNLSMNDGYLPPGFYR